MAEIKQPEDRLSVAIVRRVALVRVEGRGSFKISTSLKDFIAATVDSGAETVVIDLAACLSMDSTFMGVLAGAAGRLRSKQRGPLVLVNLQPKTRTLIATLGLDQIVSAFDAGRTPAEYAPYFASADLESLPTGGESSKTQAETVLAAHETLVSMNPENAPRFKDVLVFLREDLKRKTESPGQFP